ncbi:hypothetical protein QEO76_gp09 [Arthrobacter phage Cole]|uniref:Uncharacterized protein n=1 Tax=Arthrobacter phage Cole TaxID=2944951 RepID=A0A9E7E5L9_9CAUD|nr:hypothetical protein QEO76_gp09 [Arthrobacter phage Cole]URC18047.1 hypothetical protein SEA_COLE_9 [Arthrobacter phage Cole]
MATTYKATAAAVKVSVGPADGNRVARIIRRDGIIPEGVEADQLKRLEKLGLIEKVTEEADSTEVEAAAKAEAEAAAKAAADAKAKAEAEAAAKKAAPAK